MKMAKILFNALNHKPGFPSSFGVERADCSFDAIAP